MRIRTIAGLLLSGGLLVCSISGCSRPKDKETRYEGPYSSLNGTYGGVDDLGRVLPLDDGEVPTLREDRKVGIFYFLWQGEHGTGGPYDNNKIVREHPDAILSEQNWLAAGGGRLIQHHFWGEPLFGYYTSKDNWVLRKHLQMLTDAGVDFIVFDTTNGPDNTYINRALQVIRIWYDYWKMGWNVPKIAFYTNSDSGESINRIYQALYQSETLQQECPDWQNLWFLWDGKPMIIGNAEDPCLSAQAQEFFRIKASQWPNAPKQDDGFPWMEFERSLTSEAIYGNNGRKEVMNVSIAQHADTCKFSATAWYGANDRSRSWHNGANDRSEDALLYGYNFAEQWEYAIAQDPEVIFITGWNEWVAQRQPAQENEPIVFVDCADPNTSRDAEPMTDLWGDNYYMQMIRYIRQYKGIVPRVDPGPNIALAIDGGFDQWNQSEITAVYRDYAEDTKDRDCEGFGGIRYQNDTGRNDIVLCKAARNEAFLFFYLETQEEITQPDDDHWMTLFLNTGRHDTANWYGYDFAVNLVPPEGGMAILSQCEGGWSWSEAGKISYKMEGNQLMLTIPRTLLGLENGLLNLQFKWADHYQGEGDIWSFYRDGDAAPYGRLTFVFSEKA